ncbi:hypothetical protein [Thauera sp. 63]|uniref:hypothetical protein n=1 Tax=Thauera sp. 63 TaxID=497321 RepID=UPI0012F8E6FB|nr:hypothetical protein [Thauera sp. 63]
MAHLRRLMFFVVGFALVALPMLAMAQDYPARKDWSRNTGSSYPRYPDWNAACGGDPFFAANPYESDEYGYYMLSCRQKPSNSLTGVTVYRNFNCDYGGTQVGDTCVNPPACPEGQERNTTTGACEVQQTPQQQCEDIGGHWYGGQCITCTPGYTWTGTECKNPCEAKAGNSYGTSDSWAAVSSAGGGGSTFCDGTCAVQATATECTRSGISGQGDFVSLGESCVMRGPFKMTGTTCGGDGTYPTLDYVEQQERPWWESGSDEKGCQATGGYWGQAKGIDACVAPQPGETVQNDTTTTPAEGNKNTTTNPDGSTTETTTKETTSTDGGKATTTKETTTIYRNPDGSIANEETKTETTEQPLSEFCKSNPAHPSCVGTKTEGSFAGSCSGGFKCSGDAVQCAIAEAVHKQRCDAAQAETEAAEFLQQVGTGTIESAKVAQAINADGEFDFDIASAFQSAQDNYVSFTEECLPSLGFEFKGRSYTFDTGFICEIGDFVRVMLHMVAYMAVLGVITRAFGG